MTIGKAYLESVIKCMKGYKNLAEAAIAQLQDEDFYWKPDSESNSIAQIVRHMSGNMLSRWTNFLTEDGEKPWRHRDLEFEEPTVNRTECMEAWNKGWNCLIETLESLKEDDLLRTIYIREEPLLVTDAINRALAHNAQHVGQIVYVGKMIRKGEWKSLSIPRGQSQTFNDRMHQAASR